MPEYTPGYEGHFALDSASQALVNLTGQVKNVSFDKQRDQEDITTLGEAAHRFAKLLHNGSFSVEFVWSPTIATHLDGIDNDDASKTFAWGPGGNTSGLTRFTGECHLTNYSLSGGATGVVMCTANFQIDGEVTVDTY